MSIDICIVGGGIVGLASALQIARRAPDLRITILEKEAELALHQSGHNSGVLHTGVYYKPGSYKARNCSAGRMQLEEFCAEHSIPFKRCGKLIVAVDDRELQPLDKIYERGQANGVRVETIGPERIREIEPQAAGKRALWVPDAGVIEYPAVCRKIAELLTARGVQIRTETRLNNAVRHGAEITLETSRGDLQCRLVVNCAGLHSDRVAILLGCKPALRIIPFKGEYYAIKPEHDSLCRALIYPVPDPNFPFLGVHLTRMFNGTVECGPNAVLAGAREGYGKLDFSLRDLGESLSYPGFLKFSGKYLATGLGEIWRSLNKGAFLRSIQRLVPAVRAEYLVPAPAGIRAQAISADGRFVDDFEVLEGPGMVNILNAPSPAATSCLSLGAFIAEKALQGWRQGGNL